MKKFKVLLFLAVVAFMPFIAFAQGDVKGMTLKKMPQSYVSPKGVIEGANAKRKSTGDPMWIVYSDRDKNQTYKDKNCSQKNISLNFLECCVVADETEDALRLVRFDPSSQPFEDKPGKKEFVFKPNAEDVGWIKKKYLILWSNALVDDSTNYTKKAISVKKLEDGNITNLIKKGILDLYNYPDPKPENDNKRDITLFQYLFVFKEDIDNPNMVLLSRTNKITTGQIGEDMLGWASRKQLHIWDNAVCLRINFDPDAVNERKEKKIDVKFFSTVEDAKNFRDGKNDAKNLPFYYKDPTSEGDQKENPYLYGFPIIEKQQKENSIFKTGYVTNTVNKNGESVFTARKQASLNAIYEDIKKGLHDVNIIFVMDGNYKPFFKTVASSLNDIAYIGGDNKITRNDYKLGAVIYNDANADGDEKFKIIRPGTNKDNFIDKLTDEASKTTTPSNRDANGAPLFEAIKKACDLYENSRKTNIMVIIGAAGDKDKTQKKAALDALLEKQVKMNIFQVQSKDGDVYDNFLRDGSNILLSTASGLDEKYFKTEIASGERKKVQLKTADNYAYLENALAPGMFLWKDKGESFKQDEINKKLKKLVRENEDKMSSLLGRYEQNTQGAERGLQESNEEEVKQMMALFKERGISNSDLEKLASQENFQLFIQAYAPTVNRNLTEPIMVRTLFISRREFEQLSDAFDKLNESYSGSNMRENLVTTYQEIILKYKGSGNLDPNFSLNDFMKLVTSLPPTGNKLFARRLEDLKNEKKTTLADLEQLKTAFYNINKRLKEIKKLKSARMEQEDDTFYWVPENVFHVD